MMPRTVQHLIASHKLQSRRRRHDTGLFCNAKT
jgi:hypothetical protein